MDIKKLQDEAAELANRIDAVRLIDGNEDKIAERDLELETLVKRSSDVSKKLGKVSSNLFDTGVLPPYSSTTPSR